VITAIPPIDRCHRGGNRVIGQQLRDERVETVDGVRDLEGQYFSLAGEMRRAMESVSSHWPSVPFVRSTSIL
jgi:hypothetical protein